MPDIEYIERGIYPISATSSASEYATADATPRIAGAVTPFFLRSSKHGTVLTRTTLERSISLSLTELRDDNYEIKQPIPITLQLADSDEFVAVVGNTTIAMSGSSAMEAVRLLREHIVLVYDMFLEEDLGPEPQKQRRIMEAYIAKKSSATKRSETDRKQTRGRNKTRF